MQQLALSIYLLLYNILLKLLVGDSGRESYQINRKPHTIRKKLAELS